MKIDRKISTKTVCGDIKKTVKEMIKNDEASRNLYQVMGIATRVLDGTTDNGPWIAFGGTFKAINMSDGIEVRSAKCFLPDTATDMVLGALSGDEVKSAEFAFIIGIELSDDSITGYVYTVEPMLEPSESDPLEMLSGKIDAQQKALEAPEKAEPKKKK